MIKSSYYIKSFKHWFHLNQYRFPFPTSLLSSKMGITLSIAGLTPLLNVNLYPNGVTLVSATHNGEHWDLMADFTVIEVKEGDLHFCAECCDPKYFKTADELYADHNFEPMLTWLSENLKTENWLLLLGNGSIRFAKISDSADKQFQDYVFSTLLMDKKDACSE